MEIVTREQKFQKKIDQMFYTCGNANARRPWFKFEFCAILHLIKNIFKSTLMELHNHAWGVA